MSKYVYKGEKINIDFLDISLHDVSDNFSFLEFLDYFIAQRYERIDLDDFDFSSEKPFDEEISLLYEDFTEKVKSYEKVFFEEGIDPSLKIIELAKLYKNAIYLLGKEKTLKEKDVLKEEEVLNDEKKVIMGNLIAVLKRVNYIKEREEEKTREEKKKRIDDYNKGILPFYKLHYGDIKTMRSSLRAVDTLRAFKIKLSDLESDKMYNEYTLEELYYFILEKEKTL